MKRKRPPQEFSIKKVVHVGCWGKPNGDVEEVMNSVGGSGVDTRMKNEDEKTLKS